MVKLDAMENPYLLPPALREELAQRLAALELNRYPVPSYTRLKAAICGTWACLPAMTSAGQWFG
jgi:histidinol-phosphate aminotransferase